MRLAPRLDTERLVLRAHALADFEDCAAMWADAQVVRHIGGVPFSAADVWARLLRYAGHWSLLDYGYWIAHDRASGRFVGELGFAEMKREITPESLAFRGAPEIGWALASWAHGRGLATEAVRAIVEWSDRERDWPRTVCLIDVENAASVRVARKCGYREYALATYKGSPMRLFERLRAPRGVAPS